MIDEGKHFPAMNGKQVFRWAVEKMLDEHLYWAIADARWLDDANFDRGIALGDLAAAAGSSQAHFSRAFHFATGCSPYRYLLQQRVAYAKVLLLTSAEPLDRIASRCGFNRAHQFGLAFKHLVGVGPKRYRGALAAGRNRSRGE